MSAVLVNKEKNKAVFTVEIQQDKFEDAIQKAYLQNRGRFAIHGFRKGKVPRKIIELNYGEGVFYEDAINILLPEVYESSIDELELDPVDNPEIDIDEFDREKPIKIKFEVDIMPEPKLGDLSTLEAEIESYEVKEEDIERVIDNGLDSNSRLVTVEDRAVKNDDILNIDFEGFVDGEAFEGGKADGYSLTIGSKSFIPGFEEQLIGKNIGEESEIEVSFPDDYHEESLKGKKSTFKVIVNSIQEKIKPELDDEFVKDVSEFDTVAEYKASIKEELEKQFRDRERIEKENKAVECLISISEVDVPESMINNEVKHQYDEFLYRIKNMGLDAEQYFTLTNSDENKVKEELRPNAEMKVKGDLVLDTFIKESSIDVSEEELEEEYKKIAQEYDPKNVDKFVENIKKSGNVDFVADGLKKKKAVVKLVEMTNFKTKEAK